ncbi:MAG: hypothetical protein R3Y61_01525 [Rikenellaceae bacterium]
MKKLQIRTLLLTLMLIFGTSLFASGQILGNSSLHDEDEYRNDRRRTSEINTKEIAEERTDDLDRLLKLSNSQESKVYRIYLKYANEMASDLKRSRKEPTRREMDRIMEKQAPRTHKDILKVLDSRQEKDYRRKVMKEDDRPRNNIRR